MNDKAVSRFQSMAVPLAGFLAAYFAAGWFVAGFGNTTRSNSIPGSDLKSMRSAIRPAASAFHSDEDRLAAIMTAVAIDKPLLRAHRLKNVIGELNSGQVALLFEQALRIEDSERRATLLSALVAHWVTIDPAAARLAVAPFIERFRSKKGSDWNSMDTIVALIWAHASPATALAEAMVQPNSLWAASTAQSALSAMADGDPLAQLEALAKELPSRLREDLSATLIKALAERDSSAAEAQLGLLSRPRLRTEVHADILTKLAERDAAAALGRIASLAGDLTVSAASNQLLARALRAAGRMDPASTLATIEGFPEDLRAQAMGTALVGWANDKPLEALGWALDHGVDPREATFVQFQNDYQMAESNNLIGTALGADPGKTLDWIFAQPASPQRDQLLLASAATAAREKRLDFFEKLSAERQPEAAYTVVTWLVGKDQARAAEWIQTLPQGEARASALRTLLAAQARKTPDQQEALLEAWPSGADRTAVLCGIVSAADLQHGLSFARRIDDPEIRNASIASLVRRQMSSDPASTRAWLATSTELSAGQKHVILREADDR